MPVPIMLRPRVHYFPIINNLSSKIWLFESFANISWVMSAMIYQYLIMLQFFLNFSEFLIGAVEWTKAEHEIKWNETKCKQKKSGKINVPERFQTEVKVTVIEVDRDFQCL